MRDLFESALRVAAQRRHHLRFTDLGGQVMVQVTRRPRAAARSAIYRDLSFFFDLNATRQLDLRNQAISVPSAGGISALTQISTALRLVGWSVTSTAPKLYLVSLLDRNPGRLRLIERPARSLIPKGYKVVAASEYSPEAIPNERFQRIAH